MGKKPAAVKLINPKRGLTSLEKGALLTCTSCTYPIFYFSSWRRRDECLRLGVSNDMRRVFQTHGNVRHMQVVVVRGSKFSMKTVLLLPKSAKGFLIRSRLHWADMRAGRPAIHITVPWKDIQARLLWAHVYVRRTLNDWYPILFTDPKSVYGDRLLTFVLGSVIVDGY